MSRPKVIQPAKRNSDNMAIPSRYYGLQPAADWCNILKAKHVRQYGKWEESFMEAMKPIDDLSVLPECK